jgi:hypothetical protein
VFYLLLKNLWEMMGRHRSDRSPYSYLDRAATTATEHWSGQKTEGYLGLYNK